MSPLRVLVCALVLGAAAAQRGDSLTGSRLASFARAVVDSPQLAPTVERALSRALGVPQPRLAGLGTALQGALNSISLGNLQTTLAAMGPAIAVAAFVISIVALVKVTILFKSSGLNPYEALFDTFGHGLIAHDIASGYDSYGGYGRYEPAEYVHHAPHHIEYGHEAPHHGHDLGHHGAVAGYARSYSPEAVQTGEEGQLRARANPSSDGSSHDSQPAQTTAKPGRILFS